MSLARRALRHARLSYRAFCRAQTPPFLVLFINSTCNQKCEHCFYWRSLNQPDDLTFNELQALSRSLGPVEILNLSGGEPFLRADFAQVCLEFIRNNRVRQIYVPSNGYFTKRMVEQVTATLASPELDLLAVEFSLEGLEQYHDRFRVSPGSFRRALESYHALAAIQLRDPRLRLHAISTATGENIEHIGALSRFLYHHCPAIDHHNLALLRGDSKNPTLSGPALDQYRRLYADIAALWADREQSRFGAIVEPLLQHAKIRTAQARTQVTPCRAGLLSGVVYANGDVALCETHPPLGNLRQRSFPDIWNSPEAEALRAAIARRQCWCTNEIFLWPSIVFQPFELLQTITEAKPCL